MTQKNLKLKRLNFYLKISAKFYKQEIPKKQ